MRALLTTGLTGLVLALGGCGPAPETPSASAPQEAAPAAAPSQPPAPPAAPRRFEFQGEGVFGGEAVAYRMIAEDTLVPAPEGRPGARYFSFTYLREDGGDTASRPVVFIFNGGPGSASIWMHMGLFGPRRIAMDDPVNPPVTAPFALEDNPYSILDVADLVLIDPPGTGFSEILPGGDPSDFYGTQADAAATAAFIESWLIEHERWNSPRYLVGASYGTTRAAMTARNLAGGPMNRSQRMTAISLDGIVLIGQALLSPDGANEEQAAGLGAMAAAAWYHGQAGEGETLDAFVAQAERFAVEDYLPALYLGDALQGEARAGIAAQLSRFTGLSPARLQAEKLRPSTAVFRSALLEEDGLHLGAYDARFTLPATGEPGRPDPVGDDPAMAQYTPSYVAGLRQYLDETGVAIGAPYQAIAFGVNSAWDYTVRPPASDAVEALAGVMRANRDLRVMVATGQMDLVTHTGSADYLVRHGGLAQDRVISRRYPSGHMPYLGDDSARPLSEDLRAFVTGGE
ncbi:peptidase S10 [Marinicauda pacifica]|uniref:Peptidase S10 n=1 Tax=Marinicauda pacifica TaxID=1133559 RepID=A0A4S2HAI6_9PROT|nr:peptidase S10 [Marinicauda pacifica]TGY92934.1 peptidase S10 [Marinicauda pacifica]GGE41483.1 peptidase S10 [Marinicauda pacifica]